MRVIHKLQRTAMTTTTTKKIICKFCKSFKQECMQHFSVHIHQNNKYYPVLVMLKNVS